MKEIKHTIELEGARGSLFLSYLPCVNYSMQSNGMRSIIECNLQNDGDEAWQGVSLTIEGNYVETSVAHFEVIGPRQRMDASQLQITVNPESLIQHVEGLDTIFLLTVRIQDEIVLERQMPLFVMAFDQWTGSLLYPELLASFVSPNHPMLSEVAVTAAGFMEQWSGNSALDEYQSRDPQRARMQVAAIYEALRSQGIVYAAPPASFEAYGQRVRMVDRVLSEKLGTCLDLSLVMASALESIGIHPILVLTKGHCFLGAWLVPDAYGKVIGDDATYLEKQCADGISEIVLVEATCLASSKAVSFDEAVLSAMAHLKKEEEFEYFIDIARARIMGIRPLPLRIKTENGWSLSEGISHENATEAIRKVDRYDLSDYQEDAAGVTKQTIWERKLLDMSLRNSLLNMRLGKKVIQLLSFKIDLLEDSFQDGESFQILPFPENVKATKDSAAVFDSSQYASIEEHILKERANKRLYSYQSETELLASLKGLCRDSRTCLEENGANNLYLALGLLRWYETERSQQPRFAPILLLPVEIVRGRGTTGYIIRTRDEEIQLNITLVEMLKQQHGINLYGLQDLPKDEHGVDVGKIFAVVRDRIKTLKGWNLFEESLLGLFSFSKFVMWNDIHSNADKLRENAVVASLLEGRSLVENQGDPIDAREADFLESPDAFCLPVDVDSSQLEAVVDAGQGRTFILHGPPGTGKSQTITNMIANALGKGKRVLFVAEKMAALSVVQNRLERIGLAPFCLELHSNKVTKAHFLGQMDEALAVTHMKTPEEYARIAGELLEKRKDLLCYVEALHDRKENGLSLHDCISGYLSGEGEAMEVDLGTLPVLDRVTLEKLSERLNHLDTVFKVSGHPSSSALRGLDIKDGQPEAEQVLETSIPECAGALDGYLRLSSRMMEIFGFEIPDTIQALGWMPLLVEALMAAPVLTAPLLRLTLRGKELAALSRVLKAGSRRHQLCDELRRKGLEGILEADGRLLSQQWQVIKAQWFLPRFFAKRSFVRNLQSITSGITGDNVDGIVASLLLKAQCQEVLDQSEMDLQQLFGDIGYYGREDWKQMELSLQGASRVYELLTELSSFTSLNVQQAVEGLASCLEDGWSSFKSKTHKTLDDMVSLSSCLQQSLSRIQGVANLEFNARDLRALFENLSRYEGVLDKVHDWIHWCVERHDLQKAGFEGIIAHLQERSMTGAQASSAFFKGYYRSQAKQIISGDENLRMFNGVLFEDDIRFYRQLSAKFQELSKQMLYCKLASNIPVSAMQAVDSSEIGMLKRSIKNGGRGMSIRKIIDQMPTLLPRLCPCMLMSPLSVAQYLDLGGEKFDLVIFDEASQMPTSEAVGAIARGRSLVVVGDPRQMPPTSFFSSQQIDEEDVAIDDLESILDDCIALSIPSRYLSWHYRSKHESLIAFSNQQYYEGRLSTFPSIDDQVSKVTLVKVDGSYDKGKSRCNRAEAKAIVQEVLERLRDPELSKRSIGIVSFSSVQQNLIEDLLTDELSRFPDLEALAYDGQEPIFVKNLENVQGDERDVILFSVGYGPDESGRVSMNFGPLNNKGGERRLNVAVSRARYEMKVFSTLMPEQIDLRRTQAEGVVGLKKFLEFAQRGSITSIAHQVMAQDDGLVKALSTALQSRGLKVRTQVGRSQFKVDLAIQNPDKEQEYILGIICDGQNYYQTPTMRDREIVQPSVLKMLHWNVMHVWSLDWMNRPDAVLDAVVAQVEKLRQQEDEGKQEKIATPVKSLVAALEPVSEQELITTPCKPYVMARLKDASGGGIAAVEKGHKKIQSQILSLINAEYPITRDLIIRRIARLWGVSRQAKVIAVVDDCLQRVSCFTTENIEKTLTYWPSQESAEAFEGFRDGSDREIIEVPVVEAANAMRYVVEQQVSLSKEDLKKATAQLMGYSRKTAAIEAYMDGVLRKLQMDGVILLEDGRVQKA